MNKTLFKCLILLLFLFAVSWSALADDTEILIEGQEYEYDLEFNTGYKRPLGSMKKGESYSDDILDIRILYNMQLPDYPDDYKVNQVRVHVTPHKQGTSRFGGITWIIRPKENMPEELLGTWKCQFRNEVIYFTFHEDGKVGCSRDLKGSDAYRLYHYLYHDGMILLSKPFCFIRRFNVENGVPIPESGWDLKGKPQKISESKANWIKGAELAHAFTRKMENPGILLFDPENGDGAWSMCTCAKVEKNPRFPSDSTLKIHISDPDVLEVAAYQGWDIHLRGKKEGQAELYAEPYLKNGKATNTLTFTVLEGTKTLPDELIGKRWTISQNRMVYTIVFSQGGRYIGYSENPNDAFILVTAGHYLYRDGIIQIGFSSADGEADLVYNEYVFFRMESDGEQTILRCYGDDNCSGYWFPDKLLTGIAELMPGKYLFTDEGVPSIHSLSGTDLWMFCRDRSNMEECWVGPMER